MLGKRFIILDIFNQTPRIGIFKATNFSPRRGAKPKIIWQKARSSNQLFLIFNKLVKTKKLLRLERLIWIKPRGDYEQAGLTWSGLRRGVGLINSIAFAWNLPRASLYIEQLNLISELRATTDSLWLSPSYNREPNISSPVKNVV